MADTLCCILSNTAVRKNGTILAAQSAYSHQGDGDEYSCQYVSHRRSLGQAPTSAKSESDWIQFVTPRHRRDTLPPLDPGNKRLDLCRVSRIVVWIFLHWRRR
jgi:hypothetical protein